MGNNSAYTNFESLTVDLYNKGLLNKEILSSIMEQYRGTDIDSGGSKDLVANDGLDVMRIVLKIFGKEVPERKDIPTDWKLQTPEQSRDYDRYLENIYDSFHEITDHFGWC